MIPQRAKVAAPPAPSHGGNQELTRLHMQNFFDCVRSRKEPVCPFELGFRTSIACQMAVASYRRQSPGIGTRGRKRSSDDSPLIILGPHGVWAGTVGHGGLT